MVVDNNTGSVQNVAFDANLIALSAEIVSAFVSNNAISAADLPRLLREVHGALAGLGAAPDTQAGIELRPAVPPRKSVMPDFIVCLEDGRKFKSLKRHLRTQYNMSPDEYREKWGLPASYPMVAPNYSATRSRLAKDNGLGRRVPASAPRARLKALA